MSSRTLYELAGADPTRLFSPFCWRTRLALAHKGLDVQTMPWRMSDKEAIAFSGQGKVPVLVDGNHVVSDSWQIALYLEKTYPDAPSLFGGEGGMPAVRFINAWADGILMADMSRLVAVDIPGHMTAEDAAYFRSTREARFGAPLETVCANREQDVERFRQNLLPIRLALRAAPFLGGDTPHYADYSVFGPFQWARCISDFPLLKADDPVADWAERMLAAFDGLAAKVPGYKIAA
ncbi:glutathione S-transferase family protein [Pigmentiphaga aceris]|uniref:Glutathione S-transferase family protein n=1 Tax=Pigmentiphaga aceris TaxID=1940612 RepID=A0A5C0B4F3_9BURK|nr:glutathione S-transferase family protein [Pigmentiphaga aceris]QEI08150.1 glutathione S-transferase family protein [Pigmentiphaga aceris]